MIAALLGADEYSLRHRGDDRRGLHHAAGLPPRHLQAGRRHAAAAPAGQLRGHARGCRRLLAVRRRGGARATSPTLGPALARRGHRPGRPAAPARHRRRAGRRHRPRRRCCAAARGTTAPRHFVERVELQDPRAELGDRLLADAFRAVWDGDEVELEYDDQQRRPHHRRLARRAPSRSSTASCRRGAPPGSASRARPGRASARSSRTASSSTSSGEANDYVGKGMGGGRVIDPPARRRRRPSCPCSPATPACTARPVASCSSPGGVGERFAVRNSRRHSPSSRAPATTAAST